MQHKLFRGWHVTWGVSGAERPRQCRGRGLAPVREAAWVAALRCRAGHRRPRAVAAAKCDHVRQYGIDAFTDRFRRWCGCPSEVLGSSSCRGQPGSIGVMSRRAYIMNPWGACFSAMSRVTCHDVTARMQRGRSPGRGPRSGCVHRRRIRAGWRAACGAGGRRPSVVRSSVLCFLFVRGGAQSDLMWVVMLINWWRIRRGGRAGW